MWKWTNMGPRYGIVLTLVLMLGLLEIMACAPVDVEAQVGGLGNEGKDKPGSFSKKAEVSSETELEEHREVTVVFFDSCSKFGRGAGQREIVISGHKIKDCYNIQGGSLNPSLDKIRTHPDGLKILLFPKENCQGEVLRIPNPSVDFSSFKVSA